MTTLISTCNTKTEFRQRVRDGINVTLFDPANGFRTTLRDMHDNVGYSLTGHQQAPVMVRCCDCPGRPQTEGDVT